MFEDCVPVIGLDSPVPRDATNEGAAESRSARVDLAGLHFCTEGTCEGEMGRSEAATLRRAEKRQRTAEEQRRIDSAQEAKRMAAFHELANSSSTPAAERSAFAGAVRGDPLRSAKRSEQSRTFPPNVQMSSSMAASGPKQQRKELRDGQPAVKPAEAALAVDQIAPKFCHLCGGSLVPGAKFCSSCGSGVLMPTTTVAVPTSDKGTAVAPAAGDTGPKKGWAPQADAEQIEKNMDLRRRYATERDSLSAGACMFCAVVCERE